jgi:hypothetical protein
MFALPYPELALFVVQKLLDFHSYLTYVVGLLDLHFSYLHPVRRGWLNLLGLLLP